MAAINITVSGEPPEGTYSSASRRVRPSGNIAIENNGVHTIHWNRDKAASWRFKAPYISFDRSGPFDQKKGNKNSVSIRDSNKTGVQSTMFKYTLHTTEGDFDPTITNDGEG